MVASEPETAGEALSVYLQAGADFERRGNLADAALAYNNAVLSALALGRFQDALDIGQKAVRIAEQSGNLLHQGVAFVRLGSAYLFLGMPGKAFPLFEQGALAGRRENVSSVEAAAYYGLARIYGLRGDKEKSLEYAKKAVDHQAYEIMIKRTQWLRLGGRAQPWLRHLERIYGDALTQLGRAHVALEQWGPAKAAFQEVMAVGERNRIPYLIGQAHQGLGSIAAREGDWPTAISHLEEALRVNRRPSFVVATQAQMGRVYRGMGRLPEAEDALRKAVAGLEDLRSLLGSETLRESYFEDKVETYELLALTLLDQGKLAEAFDVSERARARAFLDLLGNRVTLSRGRSESLIAEEQALRERINALKALPEDSPALGRELQLARDAYQAFLQRVRQVDREQASLMTVEPLTLPQVQELLPEGSLLLEYFVTEQGRTILWTVERGTVSVRSLPIGRQQVDTARMAQALFNEFVRPGLQGRTPKELVIVPHGPLHYLPFQALMPAPGRYLLQETPLYYYTSASLMQFTRAKEQAGTPTIFAMGNPDFQDRTLSLPYAAREARGIATLFPDTALAIGKAATKATSREEIRRHNVLHFATHAEFDEADPLGTSLLLASTTGADSRLEVQEIFGLDLHASLVVLSACETALGTLTRGDELTGLTQAFIYAGTPSVITTLWQVNDRSAFELMREFYRQLRAGRNKAEALRLAQLAILDLHPQPYHWAAYELIGEPR